MCGSMTDIQSEAAEIRRGKKKERQKKKIEITGQKYNGLPYYIGRPTITRMWANADMAAQWNLCGALCWMLLIKSQKNNEAKTRNLLKLICWSALNSPISAVSGPKFTLPYCEKNVQQVFSYCRYMPYLRRYSPTKPCDSAQMANFCLIFASCIFSEPLQTCILNSHQGHIMRIV